MSWMAAPVLGVAVVAAVEVLDDVAHAGAASLPLATVGAVVDVQVLALVLRFEVARVDQRGVSARPSTQQAQPFAQVTRAYAPSHESSRTGRKGSSVATGAWLPTG